MSILRLMLFLARVLASGTITLQWGQTADQKGVTTPPRNCQAEWLFSLFIWLHQIFLAACKIFGFSMQTLNCGIWDLFPCSGRELRAPALGVWSLSHWAIREVPPCHNLKISNNFLQKALHVHFPLSAINYVCMAHDACNICYLVL